MQEFQPINTLKFHGRRIGEAFMEFFEHDGMASAGNMAFLAMLSIFPFVIFLIAVSGFIGQTDKGMEAITFTLDLMPAEVAGVLEGPIQSVLNSTSSELLTVSIFFALWTAGSGVEAARHALIRAFGKDLTNAFWLRRLESLAVVMIVTLLLIIAMSVQIIGPTIMGLATDLFPDAMSDDIQSFWGYLRYLISPTLVLLGLYLLYMALTPRRAKKPYRLPGAIMSLLMFLITAQGLSVYLQYAGNYDITYGSLAGVVILQVFCFIISIGFIIGAELNASYTRAALRSAAKETISKSRDTKAKRTDAETPEINLKD